jgi:hypothetical protein
MHWRNSAGMEQDDDESANPVDGDRRGVGIDGDVAAWIVSRTIAESEGRLRMEIQTGIQTVNHRIDAVNRRIDILLLDRER